MNYVSKIVNAFGGVRALARFGGWPPSTVQSWNDRGSIPDRYKAEILAGSDELCFGLEKADFFPQWKANVGATESRQQETAA